MLVKSTYRRLGGIVKHAELCGVAWLKSTSAGGAIHADGAIAVRLGIGRGSRTGQLAPAFRESARLLPFFRLTATAALLALATTSAASQSVDALTRPYPADACPSCDAWSQPQAPFRIHGSTYYVGTRELAVILIASPQGHVLIDGALPNSAPAIMENIRSLGFEVEDVGLILNSHAHHDHAAGIAALERASGARVAASAFSAAVLERGTSMAGDPQHGHLLDFPAVPDVERFADGDSLRVGPIVLTAHLTPGHTPGGTTWTWRSCDDEGCLDLVYADSQTPVSADGFRFSDSAAYPAAVGDFERSFRTLEMLPCDILITPHPVASSFWKRLESEPERLIDRNACKGYAAGARRQLERRLEAER